MATTRRHVRGPALTMVALLVAIAALAACTPGDVSDPFYRDPVPPANAPAKPGDVIRSRPSIFSVDAFTHHAVVGVNAWQVLYDSTDASGHDVAVSGTVLVPAGNWTGPGQRPIIGYGVGTRGLGDQCAPSHTLANGTDYEGSIILEAVRRGWAVVVTDMIGLGTPGTHTYGVGRDQGHAALDAVRAAERMPETGLTTANPVAFWGYSQGGQTAGWAAELAPTYAPELNVTAIVAGGVPADLRAVAHQIDGGLFMSFVMIAAAGYDAAYPELHLAGYLNARGRNVENEMLSFCLVDFQGIQNFASTAYHHILDYVTTNPLDTPAWMARLAENKLGSGRPSAPVLLMQAPYDELVPRAQAVGLRDGWCSDGADVTWDLLPPSDHVVGIVLSVQPTLDFLTARFAGVPTEGNCATR